MNMNELLPKCGIYRITNTSNGKIYIGKSIYILYRLTNHIAHLSCGKHCNKELSDDFIKYGLSVFDVDILCECPPENLPEIENKYIDNYRRKGSILYNVVTKGRKQNPNRYHL